MNGTATFALPLRCSLEGVATKALHHVWQECLRCVLAGRLPLDSYGALGWRVVRPLALKAPLGYESGRTEAVLTYKHSWISEAKPCQS